MKVSLSILILSLFIIDNGLLVNGQICDMSLDRTTVPNTL